MKNCLPNVMFVFLILIFVITGIWMLVTGIGGIVEQKALMENYETAEGQLSDYTIASPGGYDDLRRRHTNTTYRLTYTYFVDNLPYTVTTEYSTGDRPALGSARTVYYDPANPENAILDGTSGSSILLFGGAMFTLVPMLFILVFCSSMGWLPKTKIDFIGLFAGGVMAVIGGGFLTLMEGGGGFHPMKLIPWLMIAAGVWVIIRGIFFPGQQTTRK